ncbi:helix-turn-helix transcriptional regulator [Nocardia asteroides]|uniref:helix-turn-helix transcriptional regulator n=1 Tax=Nocardia asteroides TaxID=1824 RepID=UPI001E48E4AE|nr:LuxR family transcriptional regulator [Nocardia asteroides]UGT55199.1 AAA family ATPase [Nocardia asteroides]
MSDESTALIGREADVQACAGLLGAARNGLGNAVRLVGEPGIGKTALIEVLTGRAAGFRILRADSYEVEQFLPYAGVQRLVADLDGHLGSMPSRERDALAVAVGRRAGPAPDRFLVGRALLGLFAVAARERAVLCVIDDAQWMDRESLDAIGFAARRLAAEAVAVVVASRPDPEMDVHLAGITIHHVSELDRAAAVELLIDRLGVTFDPVVAAAIVDAVGGNPLALTDLAADLGARGLTEVPFAPTPPGAGHRLEQLYQRQMRALPAASREWLLVAAAESTGQLRILDRAAMALRIPEDAGEAADSAGLVTIGAGFVRFRHPLVRAAVYGAAPAADRRRAHAALAHAAAETDHVDLAARHAAEASSRPDDRVADRLVAAADRASRRGGMISRAGLLRKAAELTEDPALRQERVVSAAESAAEAGAGRFAIELIDRIDLSGCDAVLRGRLLMLRSWLATSLSETPDLASAAADLVVAARLFHGADPDLERLALQRAFDAAVVTEKLMRGTTLRELGEHLRDAATRDRGVPGTVLAGLAALLLDPYPAAVAPMRAAVEALASVEDAGILLFGTAGVVLTTALWDTHARDRHLDQIERIAVGVGALKSLNGFLWTRSMADLDRGDVAAAGRAIERVREIRRAMGYSAEHLVNGARLAWTGHPRALVTQVAESTLAAGFAGVSTLTVHALAIRTLADGDYAEAFDILTSLRDSAFPHLGPRQLPEYVEAGVRGGHRTEAVRGAEEMARVAAVTGSPWARGISERCRALVDSTLGAEDHFRSALDTLATTNTPGDLYRTHLLYGEWLRRRRRRTEARTQLQLAFDGFALTGAVAFAQRARRELATLGEHPRPQGDRPRLATLTVQEFQVAMLAAEGSTNADIAATMFISPHTVDYHLRKVFRKLDISSRRALRESLHAQENRSGD